jgi:hypothetical protein
VSDRTAPFCVGILSLSSRDLKEQHRVLSKCRIQLAESKIQSGQHLLHALGSIQEAGISGEDLVLQHFFHLSLDEIKVLSARLKCNLSSEVITLPSVVNVFFEHIAEKQSLIIEDDDILFCIQDDGEEELELDPFRRMQSNDPILLKNQASASAFVSPASKGGQAVQHLPECDISAQSDVTGSFHVEVVPFVREKHSVEPFCGTDDGEDEVVDGGNASMYENPIPVLIIISCFGCCSQSPHHGDWRDVKRKKLFNAAGEPIRASRSMEKCAIRSCHLLFQRRHVFCPDDG